MLVAFDTNIVVYAEGFDDPDKAVIARTLIDRLPDGKILLPNQVLGEVFSVLTIKKRVDRDAVMRRLDDWTLMSSAISTSNEAFWRALQLASSHRLQVWDAVILATAEDADCEILLSEDMQHGFQWRRITVVNPFIEPTHPLLADVLAGRK